MRFIRIETAHDNDAIAINPEHLTSLKLIDGSIWIYLSGAYPIETKFTDIQHAVDYIQRAPSISLSVSE